MIQFCYNIFDFCPGHVIVVASTHSLKNRMICPHIGLSKMLNTKKQLYLTSLFQTCDTTEAIHTIHSNLLPHLEGVKNKIFGM